MSLSLNRAPILSLGLCLALCFPAATLAQDKRASELQPAQLLQNVATLREEIEQIRLTIGKRLPRSREFKLADVEPRQVFFQAQTLFRKCNRLAQEVAGVSRQAPMSAPEHDVSSVDVNTMIDAARQQLQLVKKALEISAEPAAPKLRRRTTSADVMHDIIEAGYILNQLVSERADWADIYDRVAQMQTYIGGGLPDQARYPTLPDYECCKMPQDVYALLAEAMDRARPLAESVDLALIRVIPGKAAEGGASTDTVYDLTTTMVSDLAELTLRMELDEVAGPSYERPPRIYPSHVYALAKVLGDQITTLNTSR
ncbi:MAG: hypothetical protein ACR2PZ_24630 [Pseudomonadales bacterium]